MRKPKVKRPFGILCVDEKIILEWILKKWVVIVWTRFIWLRIDTSCGLL
jgi:hypothetical protein